MMNRATQSVLVAIAIGVGYLIYNSGPVDGGETPGGTTDDYACDTVTAVDFAIAVEARGPILAVTPAGTPKTKILTLQHESHLETSTLELCEDMPAGTTCAQINAFTWGYDWIPLKTEQAPGAYCLDSLTIPTEGVPGWAILYFVRDDSIFGLAWGGALESQWPAASNPNLIKTVSGSFPGISEQVPLHTKVSLEIERATITGLDFNAWVNPIGAGAPGGIQDCYPLPAGTKTHDGRLYYAAPYVVDNPGSGLMIWFTEPVRPAEEGGEWKWSVPALLSTDLIPGLPEDAEIDSLAYDRRVLAHDYDDPNDPHNVDRDHRHLMISVVRNDEPWPVVDETRPEEGPGSYYIVPVLGNDGAVTYGEPRPVYIELAPVPTEPAGERVRLQTIIGPRSRGTCPTDPSLYKLRDPDQKQGQPVEAASPQSSR